MTWKAWVRALVLLLALIATLMAVGVVATEYIIRAPREKLDRLEASMCEALIQLGRENECEERLGKWRLKYKEEER